MSSDTQVRPSASGRTGVAKTNLQDPEPFLKEYANKIEGYREKASAMKVCNDHDAERCGALAGGIAREVESLERQRKEFVDPLNQHVKLINGRFRNVTQPLSDILQILKGRIGAYWQQKRIAEDNRLEKERERLAKLQERREERAEAKGTPPPPPPPPPMARQVPKSIGPTTKVREIWDFEVTDLSLVPFEYLEVVGARVRRAIADGKRDIKGLKIFQKPSVAV